MTSSRFTKSARRSGDRGISQWTHEWPIEGWEAAVVLYRTVAVETVLLTYAYPVPRELPGER